MSSSDGDSELVDDEDNHDEDNHDEGNLDDNLDKQVDAAHRATIAVKRVSIAVTAVLVPLMVLFVYALIVARPVDGVVLVVIGDPAPTVGTKTPVRVLGLHRDRPVSLQAQFDEQPLDAAGFGTVIASARAPQVSGTARLDNGEARAVALALALTPGHATGAAVVTTTPWSTTLALPAVGAAVYPEHGLVAGRGGSLVVLVGGGADNDDVEIIEVTAQVDGRLPDGRLLAIDRLPLRLEIDDESLDDSILSVALHARERIVGVIDVHVDGHLVVLEPIVIDSGDSSWRQRLPRAHAGALVVVNVAMSMMPSAARRQTLARVGGWSDGELLKVEPRAAAHLDNPVVRRALASRFVVEAARPAVLSPSFRDQEQAWRVRGATDASAARRRFRQAGVVVLAVLAALAVIARVRPGQAVTALLVVAVVGGGLDAVLGLTVDSDDVAAPAPTTSGSP